MTTTTTTSMAFTDDPLGFMPGDIISPEQLAMEQGNMWHGWMVDPKKRIITLNKKMPRMTRYPSSSPPFDLVFQSVHNLVLPK